MPKMKTSRAAAKRFKVTGTGKLKRSKAYKRHINNPLGIRGLTAYRIRQFPLSTSNYIIHI